jgi:hypothetical protein
MSSVRLSVRIGAVLVSVLLALVVLEVFARIAYHNRDSIRTFVLWIAGDAVSLGLLDEYEMRDPDSPANWVLRPNYQRTLGDVISEKRRQGKLLAVQQLEQTAEQLGLNHSDVVLRINSLGLKGPEIDESRTRPRVLTIGDSCTFGTLVDHFSYPRSMERALAKLGTPTEVVNGGVEGYWPRNVTRYRMEGFRDLKPEITIIYIGWNAIYHESNWPKQLVVGSNHLYLVRVVDILVTRVAYLLDPQGAALRLYNRPKRPNPSDPLLDAIGGLRPPFIRDVETIISRMMEAGSKVVLVTLPSLYSTGETPSVRALELGHLPDFTDNPFVLAKLAEEYNRALRALANKHNVRLVDLEAWAERTLRPKEDFFSDSVHLTEVGQEKLGTYLASQIVDLVRSAR